MANRCCQCSTNPDPSTCRTTITSADIATLIYLSGLDENLCEKFTPVVPGLSLVDCAGNPIVIGQAVVTCAEFRAKLCETLTALNNAGPLTLGVTPVVGQDCNVYTVPETPITVNDTTCIDLTASGAFGHTLTATLNLSADGENVAECRPDGLFVPDVCAQIFDFPAGPVAEVGVTRLIGIDCQTHVLPTVCGELADLPYNGVATPGVTKIVAQDCKVYDLPAAGGADVVIQGGPGDCVDINVVEAPAGTFTITGDVVISPNAGNELSCVGNGLYSPDTVISGQDTACIDIEVVESPANNFVITVDPIISGAEGNILECTPQGLYAAGADVGITAVDTPCLDLTVTEPTPNQFVITGAPIISPVVGNALACSELGLFVLPGAPGDPVVITGIDTNCIDITVDNPVANQWDITVTPVIDPDPTNALSCGVDGLFVATPSSFALTPVDTNCIDIAVTPTGPNSANISASPFVANTYPGYPAGCNPLLCTATGLAVPPDHTAFNQEYGTVTPQTGALAEGAFRLMVDVVVNITNPSNCRSMAVSIVTRIPELLVELISPNNNRSRTRYIIYHDFNFPTATPPVVIPSVEKTRGYVWLDNVQTADLPEQRQNALPAGDITNLVILPPGASGTYTVTGRVEQLMGNAEIVQNSGLVVRVSGTTI